MNARCKHPKWYGCLFVLAGGLMAGYGLSLSGMVRPEVVLSFLRFEDMGLLLVLGGASGTALLAYQLAPRLLRKPLAAPAFSVYSSAMNARTLGGAAIFGIGWGICGVCPGPAMAGLGAGDWSLLFSLFGMLAGAYVQGRYFGDAPLEGARNRI
ncbi:MAG: YeeE/YedE family protein [Gammaproteobacteria bacterium]|nr:YeeE/YedE family protein [Gammaproteobacteria bacterium]